MLVARHYVMLDYDVRRDLVDEATALTPGLESPTVSPLQDSDWVAVRAMVKKNQTNNIMDELYDLGARAILVTQHPRLPHLAVGPSAQNPFEEHHSSLLFQELILHDCCDPCHPLP